MFRLPCLALALPVVLSVASCSREPERTGVIRIGHFPNVTHAHALAARSMSGRGEGFLEQRLGPGVRIEWFEFNAGPSAMDALLAGTLDATYVGPSPAVNAHAKTGGEDVRVLAGATRGGAALVVRNASGIRDAKDLLKRRIATPQQGNTQDVACRAWLAEQGFTVRLNGTGDLSVVSMPNPEQLAGFKNGELDAAWTVEPWVSRLELEGDGRVLVEETDAVTTILVASARFLRDQPELARRLTSAHRELTDWLGTHPEQARSEVQNELKALTRAEISEQLVRHCWPRLRFTTEVELGWFEGMAAKARSAGFMIETPDRSRLLVKP